MLTKERRDLIVSYINENNAFSSKGKIQEQVIQNLINQTSKLSQSINELITHCKEKYDDTDNKILDFANNIENQFSNINKDILWIYNSMNEFREKVSKIRDGEDTSSYNLRTRKAIIELQPESFARMIYFIPEDDLRVSYRPENSKNYIPLSNASAGQKTTAILTFLLSYGDMPLLLDQPEDDLDNKLVYVLIVKRLKETKTKRQIIVVTHNANIPVNADAEFIISMDSESEQVAKKFDGTMDDKDIRKEICDVMEGTQFAFEMRAKKYHFKIVE